MRFVLLLWLTGLASARPPELATRSFRGATIDLVTSDPKSLRLVWKDAAGKPYRTLGAAHQALSAAADVVAVTNAGIFGEQNDGSPYPLGLHVEARKMLRPINLRDGGGNFYLKPNGVFSVDASGQARVHEAGAFADEKRTDVVWATQSGPLLLYKGQLHPAFTQDSTSRKIRNGIAVCGTQVVIAVTRDGINFWDFATFFRDELKCSDALYLDGSISRLYAPKLSLTSDGLRFAGMIVVVGDKPR